MAARRTPAGGSVRPPVEPMPGKLRYDHLQGDRFRHAAIFLRWRPDKAPSECRYDQLEEVAPIELARVFGPS